MTVFQAMILGLVQGLGEFLPISSSAHLVLIPWFFNWNDPGLIFDIGLHMGTLLAVALYFWKDWLALIRKGFTKGRSCAEGRLFWYLVLATIPGGMAGFLLQKKAETVFRNPLLIALSLIFLGIILFWADRKGLKRTELRNISIGTSILIGVSQAFAIIPGVSRSGITMTTGLLMGLTREAATRFSFLLSAPIIFGAAVIKLPYIFSNPSIINMNFLTGVFVSCISGMASIGFLLRYVRNKSFLPFVCYRFLLGSIVITVALLR